MRAMAGTSHIRSCFRSTASRIQTDGALAFGAACHLGCDGIVGMLARPDGARVGPITRTENDFSGRSPFIAMAVGKLPVRL